MKNGLKIWGIVFLMLLTIKQISAQTYDELISNTSSGKDISEKLPTLAELQHLAIENSPIFKIADTDIKIGEYKLTEEKRQWHKSFGIEGIARYGLFDNLIITEDFGSMESDLSTTEQTRVYIGGYIKLPLSEITNRSNVKAAKAEIEKLHYQREIDVRKLRQVIIIQYNNVIKAYRNVIIKSNTVEDFRMQMIRAKVDFNDGIIDITEYVRLSNMQAKAVWEFEESKIDYSTALALLEETVGIEIILKKEF